MDTESGIAPDSPATSARDLRRQKKTRQIVEAAREVFLDEGFSAASMDKIVLKAGVSKRTLYNYYAGKEDVFIDVMQMQFSLLYNNLENKKKNPESLPDQLQRIGIDLLRIANLPETLSLFRITAAEANRFPKLAHQFFEECVENVIRLIAGILEREGKHSGIRITDSKEAGEHFLDLIFGTAYLRVVFGTIAPMDEKSIKARTRRALKYFFEKE